MTADKRKGSLGRSGGDMSLKSLKRKHWLERVETCRQIDWRGAVSGTKGVIYETDGEGCV